MRNGIGKNGFTLIELSIVLVIIGLLVGGVLVGQDLIRAAGVRAQISQIEKYSTAVNTFYGKYDYLPGDIPQSSAGRYGFLTRGQYAGEGDGNGILEGIWSDGPGNDLPIAESAGESVMFWRDLSTANLIEGSFVTASPNVVPASAISGADLNLYFPTSKLGSNYIIVYSGVQDPGVDTYPSGINYYAIESISTIYSGGSAGQLLSKSGLTVVQAYAIDSKIDDGMPLTGRVTTQILYGGIPGLAVDSRFVAINISGAAFPGSSTSCFDTDKGTGIYMQYSLSQNGGAGVNCALSFQFQ